LLVKQAQRVKKGQILAILDGRAAHAASLYQAEMDLTVAEAELNRAKAPAKQQELKAEEAVVAKLEAELGNAEIEQHRYLSLRNEGAISASLMDSKNLIVNETAEDLLRAKANLASLSELRPSEIAVAEAQVERSKAAVKLARVQLDLDYVRAPIDAQVIKINTHEGETVDNKGILDLGDTRNMVAVAEVYESDFSRLRLGQLATISCDALPSTISGVVKEIGLQVEKKENLDPDPAADADSRIVEVRIAISGKDSTQVASYSNSHIRVAIKPETTKLCHR
jgi:HlyD family secretion protein